MKIQYTLAVAAILILATQPHVALSQVDHSAHTNMSKMSSAPKKAEKKTTYVCPMHPHIEGEHGDNCPICGMALVPAKTDDDHVAHSNLSDEDLEGSHRIDASMVQAIGVKTAPVKLEVFGDDIRAYGRIVPSSRVANNVTLRVEGWIENLAASALGDVIEKGQRLFDLNSPQLISAQADYFTAKKLGNDDIAKASADRLKQLGIDTKAFSLIKQQEKPLTIVPIHAVAQGVVTKLNVNNGDYIKPGMPLLSIQDLTTVWVEADVPERDLGGLKADDRTMVILPEVGKKRLGKVTYIHPVVDPKTRTGQVRIELRNPKGTLKPDSFVDVVFTAEKRHRVAVPVQAVLRSSMGSYVLRWLGEGRFKPVMVTTGAKSGEFIEIRKGLEQGQEIVTSGQFLLDAEASLKSGMGSMAGHDHGNMDMSSEKPTQGDNPHAGH